MRYRIHLLTLAAVVACGQILPAGDPGEIKVRATTRESVEQSSGPIEALIRSGELKVEATLEDTILPGRRHQRLTQYHKGVLIWGSQVVRQLDITGAVRSLFGSYRTGLSIDVTPRLGASDAASSLLNAGVQPAPGSRVELAVLPTEGHYDLVYAIAGYAKGDIREYFVDARDGQILRDYSLVNREFAVGRGTGVLNDTQKMSVATSAAGFVARDELRPASITTSDLKGDPNHVNAAINGQVALQTSDLAADADNDWSDGPVVDAHAFGGFVYDYYFKRHGRRSWNSHDGPLRALVHPVRIQDLNAYVNAGQFDDVANYYVNAFFCCGGSLGGLGGFMVYGEGMPAANPLGLPEFKPFSASLEVVAHEMTHGMTAFTSGLFFGLEAGALNESFSDQMGVAVDFFTRPQEANYLLGEQIVAGGIRDMRNPASFGDADHLSVLTLANFEVHSLASLSNHAYYLAIEGGTNRISGKRVQGVGAANREQIEKTFYRAYEFLLAPDAIYCDAVAASIFSAGEIYGENSPAQLAVFQAWDSEGFVDFCF